MLPNSPESCVPTALPTWPFSVVDGRWSTAIPDWCGALATSSTALSSPGLACTHQSPSSRAGRSCRAASTSPTVDLFWGAAGCCCWLLFFSDSRYGCCTCPCKTIVLLGSALYSELRSLVMSFVQALAAVPVWRLGEASVLLPSTVICQTGTAASACTLYWLLTTCMYNSRLTLCSGWTLDEMCCLCRVEYECRGCCSLCCCPAVAGS